MKGKKIKRIERGMEAEGLAFPKTSLAKVKVEAYVIAARWPGAHIYWSGMRKLCQGTRSSQCSSEVFFLLIFI